jgi:hypothetical protein
MSLDQTTIWNAFPDRPAPDSKLSWHTVLPHGNTFLFCLGADRPFGVTERQTLVKFCDVTFGPDKYAFGPADENGRIGFRTANSLATFMAFT